MKILIPIIGFGKAGGYRVLSELANNWLLTGHQVDFLVDDRSDDPYFPTCATIQRFDRKGNVSNKNKKSTKTIFAADGNAFSIYFGMLRALQSIGANYDVILANHSLTAIPVALARTGEAKKFYYIQAYEPEYYELENGKKAKFLKWLSILSYRLPLRQIVNAPVYIGYRTIRAFDWVPPGINKTIFYQRTSPPSFEALQTWTIGLIGRHEPSKGIRYALEAFEEIAKTDKNVRLKVAFGNLPDGWKHDQVEVVVPKNDSELADFYRSIDIMLAPGIVQLGACHYPVLEAMACGTPVVTTGYFPADNLNSWIVPVADSKAIVEAVICIKGITSEVLKKKLDIAKNAIKPFSWQCVSEKFLDLLKKQKK